MTRRVVITGIGIWSCIGKNKEEVTASLREGRSGIGIDPQRIEYGYRSPLTGIVEKPQLKGKLDRKLRMYLAEEGEYAYVAALEAFQQANIDENYLQNLTCVSVDKASTISPFNKISRRTSFDNLYSDW